eukprot:4582535-Pyramimonas_sp.AAC.1
MNLAGACTNDLTTSHLKPRRVVSQRDTTKVPTPGLHRSTSQNPLRMLVGVIREISGAHAASDTPNCGVLPLSTR